MRNFRNLHIWGKSIVDSVKMADTSFKKSMEYPISAAFDRETPFIECAPVLLFLKEKAERLLSPWEEIQKQKLDGNV